MNVSKSLVVALIACVALLAATTAADAQLGSTTAAKVVRGDANADLHLDMADVKIMIGILFEGVRPFVSKRDLDHNGDGKFDIADVHSALADFQKQGTRPAKVEMQPAIAGDVNDDGKVDVADLSALGAWLTGGPLYAGPKEAADANQDGRVDIGDLSYLAGRLAG